MSLHEIKFEEGIESVFAATRVEVEFRVGSLFEIHVFNSVEKTHIREVVFDRGERLQVPIESDCVVLSSANPENKQTDAEEPEKGCFDGVVCHVELHVFFTMLVQAFKLLEEFRVFGRLLCL